MFFKKRKKLDSDYRLFKLVIFAIAFYLIWASISQVRQEISTEKPVTQKVTK